MKSCFLITALFLLPLVTDCAAATFPAQGETEQIDVHEIVRQAVINFNTRESLPGNYTYIEKLTDSDPNLKDGHGSDTYEVMEISGHAFRRHVAHNDKSVAARDDPEQDDASRAKWLEVEHKILDEEIKPDQTREKLAVAVQKILEEAGLKGWKSQSLLLPTGESMGVVSFAQTLHQFKLPIADLAQKFHFKVKSEEIRDGRKTYVVQASPLRTKDKTDVAGNFKIKIWIDQEELQIVKVEGKAIRAGLLARADYAAFSSKTLSKKEIEDRKQQLANTRLFYGDDTVVMQEWTKVNDEVWLLSRRHVRGSHELVIDDSSQGVKPYFFRTTPPMPVEYDTRDTNYKKFRVEHRILPVGTTH